MSQDDRFSNLWAFFKRPENIAIADEIALQLQWRPFGDPPVAAGSIFRIFNPRDPSQHNCIMIKVGSGERGYGYCLPLFKRDVSSGQSDNSWQLKLVDDVAGGDQLERTLRVELPPLATSQAIKLELIPDLAVKTCYPLHVNDDVLVEVVARVKDYKETWSNLGRATEEVALEEHSHKSA
jgi:hypothetical protein